MSNAMTITLDDLRRAADEIQQKRDPVWRENARAEFWRLAYLWRGAEVSLYYRGDITDHDISDAEAIIAEVEART